MLYWTADLANLAYWAFIELIVLQYGRPVPSMWLSSWTAIDDTGKVNQLENNEVGEAIRR
jgi:hypothetical protein